MALEFSTFFGGGKRCRGGKTRNCKTKVAAKGSCKVKTHCRRKKNRKNGTSKTPSLLGGIF